MLITPTSIPTASFPLLSLLVLQPLSSKQKIVRVSGSRGFAGWKNLQSYPAPRIPPGFPVSPRALAEFLFAVDGGEERSNWLPMREYSA